MYIYALLICKLIFIITNYIKILFYFKMNHSVTSKVYFFISILLY